MVIVHGQFEWWTWWFHQQERVIATVKHHRGWIPLVCDNIHRKNVGKTWFRQFREKLGVQQQTWTVTWEFSMAGWKPLIDDQIWDNHQTQWLTFHRFNYWRVLLGGLSILFNPSNKNYLWYGHLKVGTITSYHLMSVAFLKRKSESKTGNKFYSNIQIV